MSQKFKSDIETQAGLIDSFGFTGTAGQVLSSTGTKTEWITPPQSPGGGGSSQVFYFNGGTASSVGGYYQMSPVANTGTAADFTINADGYIASFLTDVASPNQLNIPAGNWNFEIYFSASSSGGSPSFYVELYKYSSGGVFTLIASSSAAPEGITNGTTIDAYFTPLAVPATTLLATDRLAVRVYVTHSGRTITMHTQNGHLSEVITTFSTGLTALNGLTEQVQYFSTGTTGTDFNIASAVNTHTFNLPTASATNRGALSSVDWTTFNSKANASGTTNYVSKFTGATTLGNSLIFDNGTNVGIGTTGPSYKLDVQSGQLRVLSGNPSNPALIIGEAGGPGTTNQGTLQFGDATSTFKIQAGNDYAGMIFTVGSERMRILSNGYVGIGTTSPSQKLTVSGGQTLLDQLQYTRAIDITGADLNSLVTAGFYNGPSLTNAPGGNGGWFWITVETYSGDNNWIHQTATTFGSGNTANEVYTRTRTGGTWTNWKRFIDWGDISGTTNYVSKFTGNNSLGNSLIYDNGTNVGIGTTSPSTLLHLYKTSFPVLTIGSGSVTANIGIDTSDLLLNIGTETNHPFKFSTNNSEKMRITSGGNVGIGTTTPTFVTPGTTVLDVNGSTGAAIYLRANVAQGSYLRQTSNNLVIGNNTYGDIIYNTGFTEAMRVTADRLVGIGTANPSSKLQVNNSSWAITGANVSRMLQKSVGTAGDYEQHVILLHPIYNGTLIAYNKCSGTIFASRGGTSSGLINDTYNVDTASAYNSYNGTINSTIGYGRLYTCNYNGVKYLALLPDYRTSAVQYNFDGYINSTGEELKLVVYRMSNSGTIVNSEVNNSLTIFGAGVTYYQGDLGVKGAILDSSNSPGTSGQVLSSTGTGTAWTTGGGGGSQNLQQVTDVGNSTTNIIYFNGNVPIYGVNNSVFLGSENLPNGTGYASALEETSVGVYDNITGVFETGVYAKRNIYCDPFTIGDTELLTITSPNTIVDSVIKIGYDDRFFIAKLSVIVDFSTQKYTYKIIYTNTTNFDNYNFVNNIDFIFEFDTNLPPNFTIKLKNYTGNDIYANINANIL